MQRKIAYEIIKSSLINGEYANLGLKKRLNELKPIQRGFVTELVNGVLRNLYLLDYQYQDLISEEPKIELRILLDMSIYERFYLGKDAYVAINEYVNLGKTKSEKGFLNAVLRKVNEFKEPEGDSIDSLSVKYSMPKWIVKMIFKQYDCEHFDFFMRELGNEPSVFYHLNTTKASYEDLKHYDIEPLNEHIFISKENMLLKPEFASGLYYVQDYNSARIVQYLDLKEDSKLLDVCSAPGSKLFNALETIKDVNAYANDLHMHRVELIRKRAVQLGYANVNYLNEDATKIKPEDVGTFDRILIDAPCSGLGVLKRKPDLRYHILPENIDEIVQLQADILNNCSKLLVTDGIMVYSTCTINTKENSRQVKKFLDNHPEFILLEENNLIEREDSDRFYVAKLLKTA